MELLILYNIIYDIFYHRWPVIILGMPIHLYQYIYEGITVITRVLNYISIQSRNTLYIRYYDMI